MTGIYIHVPFCKRKCPYCGFYSVEYDAELKSDYIRALKRSMEPYRHSEIEADTVYFGGGTPSLLTPDEIGDILNEIRCTFVLKSDSQITLEANPTSVSPKSLLGYRKAGVNRISFGVQSANDDELVSLGRLHSFEMAKEAIRNAGLAGFDDISCDLMIGTPGQTISTVIDSADKIISLGVSHVSCYMLKIEEGTPYDCDDIRALAADDDLSADMYLELCSFLTSHGYSRYEISNFSKPGYESRHNLKYWHMDDYIGFGPAAHSFYCGKRFFVPSDIESFINNPIDSQLIEDASPDILEEYIMLSLRLSEGMSLARLEKLGGDSDSVLSLARRFENQGLLKIKNNSVSLTDNGALVSNALILELYLAAVGENR